MTQQEIKLLLNIREGLLKNNVAEANGLEKEITDQFRESYNDFPVDFIIETLTSFGHAPNIIYDDNGKFAVSSPGMQPVVTGDEQLVGQIYVFTEKDQWFGTIREALWHYLNSR